MTRITRTCGALFLILTGAALADQTRGTAEEAQALVAKAIAAYDAQGEAAFAAMSPPGPASPPAIFTYSLHLADERR